MFSKSKEDQGMASATSAIPSQTKTPRPASSAPSIIGADVRIVGDVSTSGEIQLDGIIQGDIHAASVTMGEHGSIEGTIVAEKVVVRGHVKGSIRGRNVVMERSAKVSGDVYHETLSIEAGAIIDGTFSHSDDPLGKKSAAKQPTATAATPAQKQAEMQVVESAKAKA